MQFNVLDRTIITGLMLGGRNQNRALQKVAIMG
jgi:hypothetical protein